MCKDTTWRERLTEEFNDLAHRLTKLDQFVNTSAFDKLHIDERTLQVRQQALMKQLLDVLKLRLNRDP